MKINSFTITLLICLKQCTYCFSDVVLSGIGASIWAVVIAVWIYIFQTHRAEWGEFGDDISFVIPTGIK